MTPNMIVFGVHVMLQKLQWLGKQPVKASVTVHVIDLLSQGYQLNTVEA